MSNIWYKKIQQEYFYGRLDNPSRRAVEKSLAALEEAEHGKMEGGGGGGRGGWRKGGK